MHDKVGNHGDFKNDIDMTGIKCALCSTIYYSSFSVGLRCLAFKIVKIDFNQDEPELRHHSSDEFHWKLDHVDTGALSI